MNSHEKDGAAYRARKLDLLQNALRGQNLNSHIGEFIPMPPRSRRRITPAFLKRKNEVILGFHAPRSHQIMPFQDCRIIKQDLISALPALRELLMHVEPEKAEGRVTLLSTETGIDVAIEDVEAPSPRQRATLAAMTATSGFARLAANGEVLAVLREPILHAGRASYTPPPGAFVQAVAEAENIMADKICASLKERKARRAADLFAGCGAFSLRAAEFCAVHAVEGNEAALASLQKAARNTSGLKPVTAEKRDLFRRPLLTHELEQYDAVILDPPRQGAQAQAAELAGSKVKLIVYISCNPGTFARDAKILAGAGYRLFRLDLVDQFLWSDHVELIAIFKHPR